MNEHARDSANRDRPEAARQYILQQEDTGTAHDSNGGGGTTAYATVIAEQATEISLLSVSEAVMRMDLADQPVLMFRNTGTGQLNVVYRRSDGNIVRRLSEASVAFAMLGALLVAGGFVFVARDVDADFWRVLGVLAVLSTLTTLLAPIVRRLGHRLPSMHIG